jgi:2-methylcitrate dehydratase PrpD
MGTIGATAAAGRLLNLSPEQMYECLSLGILQASGLTVVQFGGMAKRLYAGRAAETGVRSALLAERGFTAPDNVFGEPTGGFLTSFAPGRNYDVDAITRGLGKDFAANGISFKLYSCCGACHPALAIVADIVAGNPDVTVDTIEHIGIELTDHSYKHVGFHYLPDNATTAQFSVEYCVAALLLEHAVFVDQFRDELLADPRILEIVRRTTTSADPSLESKQDLRSKRAARIRLTLNDGRVFEREGMLAPGYADWPASEDELRSKFDRLINGKLTADASAELTDLIDILESLPNVDDLVSICSARTGA